VPEEIGGNSYLLTQEKVIKIFVVLQLWLIENFNKKRQLIKKLKNFVIPKIWDCFPWKKQLRLKK